MIFLSESINKNRYCGTWTILGQTKKVEIAYTDSQVFLKHGWIELRGSFNHDGTIEGEVLQGCKGGGRLQRSRKVHGSSSCSCTEKRLQGGEENQVNPKRYRSDKGCPRVVMPSARRRLKPEQEQNIFTDALEFAVRLLKKASDKRMQAPELRLWNTNHIFL